MIFLYEKQRTIPPNCLEEYKNCYPLMEAKEQYEFLYQLDYETLKEIDQIHFLYGDDRDLDFYASVLKTYSPDILAKQNKPYFAQISELRALPSKQLLDDLRKKGLIVDLINKQKFVFYDGHQRKTPEILASQEYIIFLDHKGAFTSQILNSANNLSQFNLYATYRGMNVAARSGMVSVDAQLYVDTMRKLDVIRRDYTLEGSDYDYEISSFLTVLRNKLLQHILNYSGKSKIKMQLIGHDSMIIDGAAEILLGSRFSDYNLKNGVPPILNHPEAPMIFRNFDYLEKPDALEDLYNLVFSLSRVLLHSHHLRLVKRFDSYQPVNLPSQKEVQASLTSLFFALLQDYNKLVAAPGQYFHYYIRKNSMISLIRECSQIRDLAGVIYQLDVIDKEILNNNTLMWYFIRKELHEINNSPKSNHEESAQRVRLIFNNKAWRFIGLPSVADDVQFDSMDIYFAAILIFARQVGYEGITFDDLRAIIDDLYKVKKERGVKSSDGSSRDSLKDLLKRFKNKNAAFQDIAKKNIVCKNGQYWFVPLGGIAYEVSHPKLTKEYLASFLDK